MHAALALAEIRFPGVHTTGARMIDPRDARFFLSGQMGVWAAWRGSLPAAHAAAVDTLLRYRPRRLAKESGFRISLESRLRRGLLPRYQQQDDGLHPCWTVIRRRLLLPGAAESTLESIAAPPDKHGLAIPEIAAYPEWWV